METQRAQNLTQLLVACACVTSGPDAAIHEPPNKRAILVRDYVDSSHKILYTSGNTRKFPGHDKVPGDSATPVSRKPADVVV